MASNQPKDSAADDQKFQAMCKSTFDELDKDKSGSVDVKELEQALIRMSQKNSLPAPSKQDIQDALKVYDKNKDGLIQFKEFLDVTRESFKKAKKGASTDRGGKILLDEKIYLLYLSAAFDAIDKDKSGTIESKELTATLEQFGKEAKIQNPQKNQYQKIFEKYDANRDRKIDYKEFGVMAGELFNIEVVSAGGSNKGKSHRDDELEELKSDELQTGSQYQEIDEAMKQRINLGDEYIRYIEETGLAMAFKIIFAEVLSKKIPEDAAFAYTATRLRQIGEDIAYIQNSKYKKAPVKH